MFIMDLVQTWYDVRFYWTLHFCTDLIDLDFDSRLRECKKANTSAPIISQRFQSISMVFGIELKVVGVMNLTLISSCPFTFQKREPCWCEFLKKNKTKTTTTKTNVGLYSDIYRAISFKLFMRIGNTKLCILISVWMTLIFIQGHSCMRN